MIQKILRIKSWKDGQGGNSYWLGGPGTDASGDQSGSYVYADLAAIVEQPPEEVSTTRAWFVSMTLPPTQPVGRCLTFSFNINDATNIDKFQLLQIDLNEPPTESADKPRSADENANINRNLSRTMETKEILRSIESTASASYQVILISKVTLHENHVGLHVRL